MEQSNKVTVYILPAAVRSTDPYSSASLTTVAINLPNQDGEVMRVELLATPNVQTDGLPEDPEDIEVLHVWTAPPRPPEPPPNPPPSPPLPPSPPSPPPSQPSPPPSPSLPPMPPMPPLPELAFGTAGQDCHQACEAQGAGRVCADLSQFDWTIFVSAAGLPDEVCGGKTQRSRCDMGETPLWGDSFCYYCDQVARYTPTPTFKSVCSKKFGDRKRICPCRDAMPEVNCGGLSNDEACKIEIKKCEKKPRKSMKKCKKKCKYDGRKTPPLCEKTCCKLGFFTPA